MNTATKACPIARCLVQVPWRHLMCRRHWRMVPRPLRTEVSDAWKGLRLAPMTPGAAGHYAALPRYRLAARAAIEAVEDKGTGT